MTDRHDPSPAWKAHEAIRKAIDALSPGWEHLTKDEARELTMAVGKLEAIRDRVSRRATSEDIRARGGVR